MKKQDKIAKEDWGYVSVDPDVNFSAEHNKSVINSVIEDTDRVIRSKDREFNKQVGERTAAVAQYVEDLKKGGKTTNVEKYFGKKELLRLTGKDKIDKIKKAYAQAKQKSQEKEISFFKPR